ncbi:hypothetical protein SAMN05421720_101279 [Rhodospira trueperi]|uniref:Uncharacterized protein n=1 Tax=Rhodospira trueperi TaxID=69960 RepID=A0A1G6WXJ3_9PROT|nr:hypothetical protein SAMN05421720_101279 [Rhodospira trueperi]
MTVWVVSRVIRAPDLPTHFVLTDEHNSTEVRTISEPTLTDPTFYRPIPPVNESRGDASRDQGIREGGRDPSPQTRMDRQRSAASPSDRRDSTARGWLDSLGLTGSR